MTNVEEAGFWNVPVVGHVLYAGFKAVKLEGLVAEFGVYTGTTINQLAHMFEKDIVHGFDSFEGLPEFWVRSKESVYKPGHFHIHGRLPTLLENIRLHIGWFKDTLPRFLAEHPKPFKFIHVDSDLYSSAMTVLTLCRERIIPGTVVVFDEYCDWQGNGRYPNWKEGEYKALKDSGLVFKPLARNNTERAAFIKE